MVERERAGPASDRPRVAVVIVTYNSAEVVEGCLHALTDALEGVVLAGVVVADNASTDETLVRARAALPGLIEVPTGGNLGYAAAINLGIAAAPEHGYVLILNPDTVPGPGAVAHLIDGLQADPTCGLAVPRMEFPDGRLALSLRRQPTLLTALSETVLGGPRAARFNLGEVVANPKVYERSGRTEWATGAAVLISRKCWKTVGPWDSSYLLYSEETEYMTRAREREFGTCFVPHALVVHRGGESGTSPFLWSMMLANKVRFYRSRHGRIKSLIFRLTMLSGEAVRAAAGRQRSRTAVRLLARPSSAPKRLPE